MTFSDDEIATPANRTVPTDTFIPADDDDMKTIAGIVKSAKIALVMIAIALVFILGAALIMAGAVPGVGAVLGAGLMALMAVALSQIWAVATWAADRWIARARLDEPSA